MFLVLNKSKKRFNSFENYLTFIKHLYPLYSKSTAIYLIYKMKCEDLGKTQHTLCY